MFDNSTPVQIGEFDKIVASVMLSGFDVAIVDCKSNGAKLYGANMLKQSNQYYIFHCSPLPQLLYCPFIIDYKLNFVFARV